MGNASQETKHGYSYSQGYSYFFLFFFFLHSMQFAWLTAKIHYLAGHLQSGLKFSGSTAACRNNIQLLFVILEGFFWWLFIFVVGVFLIFAWCGCHWLREKERSTCMKTASEMECNGFTQQSCSIASSEVFCIDDHWCINWKPY